MKRFILTGTLLILTVCGVGCAKNIQPTTAPVIAKVAPKGPDYQVFAALEQAREDVLLPFVAGNGANDDMPCLVKSMVPEPVVAGPLVQSLVSEHKNSVTTAIQNWIISELRPNGIGQNMVKQWQVEPSDLYVMELESDELFFESAPQCFTHNGWLPPGQHLITTVIGAETLTFKTSAPLDEDRKNALRDAALQYGIEIESTHLFEYKPAVNDDGTPVKDHEGNPLYESPTGIYVSRDDVPSPSEREMSEWTLRLKAPLFFGAKEIADNAWRKENDNDLCDIILVPGDPASHTPECPEFQESEFSVSVKENADKPIELKIKTGDTVQKSRFAWNGSAKFKLNSRIIIWVKIEKVEVGVKVKLNSITLNPEPMTGDDSTSDDNTSYAYAAGSESEETPEATPVKQKYNTGHVLDAYFNN